MNVEGKAFNCGSPGSEPSVDKYSLVGMSRSFLWTLRTGGGCQGYAQGT
jgi:hypothetical protein